MKYLILILLPFVLLGQVSRKVPFIQRYSNATVLNGSTQYWRTVSNAAGMDFGTSTDFSVIVVLRHSTATISALQRAVGKGASPNPRWSITGGISGQSISANVNDGTNSATVNSTQAINDGLFHLVVMTASRAGNLTLYVDGASTGTPASLAAVGTLTNGSTFDVGSFATASLWDGAISSVQVVSGKALSASEVSQINARYKLRGLSPSYSGASIVAWYDWVSRGFDKSNTGNHLTPTGTPVIIKVKP